MTPSSLAPLLSAIDLRIDMAGSVAIEHASFASEGASVLTLGDGGALVASILGRARISSGRLMLLGLDLGWRGYHNVDRRVSVAPIDPVLPPDMTVREYLVAGARLSGFGRREASQAASETLARLGLAGIEKRILGQLGRAEARSTVLAQAVVDDPRVLIAEAPLSGLSGTEAEYVDRVFSAARTGRSWISTAVSIHPGSPERTVADAADEILVFSSGRLVQKSNLRGLEQGTTGYTITVRGDPAALAQALAERNVALSGGPAQFWIELPQGLRPSEILDVSLEVGTPIVEMYPRLFPAPRW